MAINRSSAARILAALDEQLTGQEPLELVVIGGSELMALGAIDRSTRDVDLLALRRGADLVDPRPLPTALLNARARVAADFGLPEDWLNAAPASLLDQIHFKLYAFADQGPGKHEADLRALNPTARELRAAARWARTHDPSPGFAEVIAVALRRFGIEDGTGST